MESKKIIKILYAEDEESVANSLTRMLSTIAEVDYAKNGELAFELYKKNPYKYDVILTDIKMPKLNGIELLEKIKEQNPNLSPHKIITTAFNDTDFLLQAIELKIDKFLIKPIKIDELFECLEKIIKEHNKYN